MAASIWMLLLSLLPNADYMSLRAVTHGTCQLSCLIHTYVRTYVRMYVLYVVVPFNEGVHSELGQSTYVCTVVVLFNEGVHSELRRPEFA